MSTIRISKASHEKLKSLADTCNVSMTIVLDEAIDAYEKQQFFNDMRTGFAQLKNDPSAWQHEQEERAMWDATIADGLGDE